MAHGALELRAKADTESASAASVRSCDKAAGTCRIVTAFAGSDQVLPRPGPRIVGMT